MAVDQENTGTAASWSGRVVFRLENILAYS